MSIEARRHQYGTVFGHWKIKESLGKGSGGKSAVFRLEHADSDGVESALKVVSLIEENGKLEELSPQRRADYIRSCNEYSQWANQEVLLMNQLQGNTYIVDYLDHTFVDWADETGFGRDMLIRMERLTDLRGSLRRGERYTRGEIIRIGLHICNALVLCHSKNILHRDIKPGNIFVNKDGNYKLGDFGISKIIDSSASFMASTGIGTPQYWAPEQTSGMYDKRVDIYSLGLVLYEMANGNRLPFASSSYVRESEVQRRLMGEQLPAPSDADAPLAAVILKACAFRPENRYPTAEAFRDALAALENTQPFDERTYVAGGDETVSAVGYTTPVGGQYPTPRPCAAPAQQEYATPVRQGYATPVRQGYATPAQQEYATPVRQGYAAPVQQGYAPPARQDYPPQQPGRQWDYDAPPLGRNASQRKPEKKKSGLGILICILALLLALLVGGAVWMLWPDSDEGSGKEGAGKNDDNGKETTTETASGGAAQPQDSDPVELAPISVTDAYSTCVAASGAQKGYFCYHIPQVELQDGRGAEISNVIYTELYAILESELASNTLPDISCMHYSWGRRDNIMSVLVQTQATTYNWTEYYTYHVAAKSGRILTDGDILLAFGLSDAEYQDLLETGVREYYASRKTQIVDSVGQSTYETLVNNTLAEANLAAARPYVGADGTLCAIVNCYWYAGGEYYQTLLNLTGAGDARIPDCVAVHDPAESLKRMLAQAKVGDIITFGNYEQDNNRSNGQEPITWLVLAKENGRLLVVSEYGLENRQYHHSYSAVTWETCYLRSWLNSSFYNEAFSEMEKTLIPLSTVKAEINPVYSNPPGNDTEDYVFLLSTSEAEKYFDSDWDRRCSPTRYAKSTGQVYLDTVYHDYGWWWLRNVGELLQDACCVNSDGRVDYKDGSVNNNSAIVRPAMWIEYE